MWNPCDPVSVIFIFAFQFNEFIVVSGFGKWSEVSHPKPKMKVTFVIKYNFNTESLNVWVSWLVLTKSWTFLLHWIYHVMPYNGHWHLQHVSRSYKFSLFCAQSDFHTDQSSDEHSGTWGCHIQRQETWCWQERGYLTGRNGMHLQLLSVLWGDEQPAAV